ncbi:adaptor protein MecA [Streptococcus ruminantium]|uniref:adaptor protein MecA n=1 Tax=Streptococcus ruminantium TaxID=1917441 RepID=UPI00280FB0C0|nr:adaptor protein MecA [Streptococcus ruminantium]MDQ8820028.1 adaptor protein MecA [Streptococcus ruminantium]MDQ8836723.1 adaptor protein MecA [Streptococcus ruminantium]
MKVKQISDSTLKITIKLDDLEERGMELSDFLIPQEKTEEFFYTVLDELDLPMTFRESGMLSFRVTPKPDRVDIFVTKSDLDQNLNFDEFTDLSDLGDVASMAPDEFFKSLEQTVREKSAADVAAVHHLEDIEQAEEDEDGEQERYIYYILEFKKIEELFIFVGTVDYSIEESELYKMDGYYYLTVLVDIENRSKQYPEHLLSRMLEFSNDTKLARPVLQEHGMLLLSHAAIEELRKVTIA